jgi:hypothetical protein
MQSVKEIMKALFSEIETQYDFSQFTMEGFRRWLEQRRGRKIICMPWDMPPCPDTVSCQVGSVRMRGEKETARHGAGSR